MRPLNRRDFLRGSTGLAALLSTGLSSCDSQEAAQAQDTSRGSANERLSVAVIGVKGRGQAHVAGFAGRNNCVVTHVCDVDSGVVAQASRSAQQRQRSEPRYVQDLRRIMDDPTINIVSIATPNHWHALAAIWAMQAGKDVYVEKPVSHNVSEGRRMVEAARRYNKICQAGTQIRSMPGIRQAIEYLKAGNLGRLQIARALCYKVRPSIGRVGPEGGVIPATLDYNLWCGPAPVQQPLRRRSLHYDWHWIWDYGNGDLGNQGIHQMDVARWGLGKSDLGRSAISAGGRFGYVDDGETANTQVAVFDYGDQQQLIFEVRGLNADNSNYRSARVGNVFHCANGDLVLPGYSTAIAFDKNGVELQRWTGGSDQNHFDNFVQAVRSRRREAQNGEIEEGHLSSALCHLANMSYRLGRPTPFGRNNVLGDDAAVNETLQRTAEHLKANMVSTDTEQLRVGRRLTMTGETCGNDQEANRMLTREYRRGFEVPSRF
jgi:predicted dehydrogenase